MPRNRVQRPAQMRAAEQGEGVVDVLAVKVGVVDDYGTLWSNEAFAEELEERLPTMAWGHDWREPIGKGIGYQLTEDGPRIQFQLDDFDDVPTARRAWSQIRSGTLEDVSIGFGKFEYRSPTDDEKDRHPGVREVATRARIEEVSVVLRGAVPGAKVLATRSANQRVPLTAAEDLATQLIAGDITFGDFIVGLREAAVIDSDGIGEDGESLAIGDPGEPIAAEDNGTVTDDESTDDTDDTDDTESTESTEDTEDTEDTESTVDVGELDAMVADARRATLRVGVR